MFKKSRLHVAYSTVITIAAALALALQTSAVYSLEIGGGGGGMELKTPVGFERWRPHPAPEPSTIVAPGAGWFFQNNLTMDDINIGYALMGFRAFDVEVERWGEDPRFSAVFIQNTGKYEAMHWFVTIGTEQDLRNQLFGGQFQNYRMMDLEVHQYAPTPPPLKNAPKEVTVLEDEICALLVTNEGQQCTPEWDFIVHATPIELLVWTESYESSMRIIDQEMSLNAAKEYADDPELLEHVLYSQIIVSDEGIEHVETTIFQFSTPLDLVALQNAGWQLIDSERNIPLLIVQFPKFYGTFTGLFVEKPNTFEFYDEQDDYSLFPSYSTEEKRLIDLELFPKRIGQLLLDETYLQYE